MSGINKGDVVRCIPFSVVTKVAEKVGRNQNGKMRYGLAGVTYNWLSEENLELLPAESCVCQRCESRRLLAADFECYAGFNSVPGSGLELEKREDGNLSVEDISVLLPANVVAHGLTFDGAKELAMVICLECGQLQGKWPAKRAEE